MLLLVSLPISEDKRIKIFVFENHCKNVGQALVKGDLAIFDIFLGCLDFGQDCLIFVQNCLYCLKFGQDYL